MVPAVVLEQSLAHRRSFLSYPVLLSRQVAHASLLQQTRPLVVLVLPETNQVCSISHLIARSKPPLNVICSFSIAILTKQIHFKPFVYTAQCHDIKSFG